MNFYFDSFRAMMENFEFEDKLEEKFNPWNVTGLDDFLFYCCPECDRRTVSKSDFIQHAVNNHPRSESFLYSNVEKKDVQTSMPSSESCIDKHSSEPKKMTNVKCTQLFLRVK